jgi:hypothetical protein
LFTVNEGNTLLFVQLAECKNLPNSQSSDSIETEKPININKIPLVNFVGMRFAD